MRFQQLIGLCAVLSFAGAQPSSERSDDRPPKKDFYRICPLPECDGCPPVEQLRAPGVGFALETGYGAAVVRLHDGSYQKVALIEGNDAYTALLRRLGTGPINRIPHHFDTIWEKAQYVKARAQRHWNKLRGLPATEDTAVLAEMVAALRDATQTWLGEDSRVANVVISSPDRVALSEEETGDVLDYLSLRKLGDERLYSVSAAYAGSGRGLCTNYLDADLCDREEWYFPLQRILHIDLNEESLSASIKSMETARHGGLVDVAFIDPELGYRHKTPREGDDPAFWEAVTARVRELVLSMPQYVYVPHVSELLLTGTHVDDRAFQRAIRDAIEDLVEKDAVANLDAHLNSSHITNTFAFLTAQGAAEIAKRYLEGPVGCAQTDECRNRREREHAGKASPAIMDQSVLRNLDL